MDEENKEAEFMNKVGTEFYHKAAKIMFQKNLTVSKVLGDRVFDMMINNRELELVYSKDMFNQFERMGVSCNKDERSIFVQLFSISQDGSQINVEKVKESFEMLGIRDSLP